MRKSSDSWIGFFPDSGDPMQNIDVNSGQLRSPRAQHVELYCCAGVVLVPQIGALMSEPPQVIMTSPSVIGIDDLSGSR